MKRLTLKLLTMLILSIHIFSEPIKIGMSPREDKYYFYGANGQVEGLVKELLDYIEDSEGLEYELKLYDSSQLQEALLDGEVDYIFKMLEDGRDSNLTSKPLGEGQVYFYSTKESLTDFSKLKDKVIGIEIGDSYYKELVDKLGQVSANALPLVSTDEKLLFWNSLTFDGIFSNIEDLEKVNRSYVKSTFKTPLTGEFRFIATEKKDINFINKHIEGFFSRRYIRVSDSIDQKYLEKLLNLNDKEKEYIENNPIVKVGVFGNEEPLEYIDEDGIYSGIVAEFLAEVSYYTGLDFEFELLDSSGEALAEKAGKNEVQMVPLVLDDYLKTKRIYLTDRVIPLQLASMTLKGNKTYESLIDFEGESIVVERSLYLERFVRDAFMDIEVVFVEGTKEGIKALEDGKGVAYLSSYLSISNELTTNKKSNIQLGGLYENYYGLRFAINDVNRELLTILNKAIALVDKGELIDRWTEKSQVIDRVEEGPNYFSIVVHTVSFIFISLFTVYLYWQIRSERLLERERNKLINYIIPQVTYDDRAVEGRSEKYLQVLAKLKGYKKYDIEYLKLGLWFRNLKKVPMAKESIHINEGYKLAKELNMPELVCNVVRYHHEKWNGRGLARGLRKEEIPLEARIVSLVTFVAKYEDISQGIKEGKSLCEINFDPELISLIEANIDLFME